MIPNYYKLFEVREDASYEVIEKAHKALSAKYHPDRHPPERCQWATRRMQHLNEGLRILRDPVLRAGYDQARRHETWDAFWDRGLIGLARLWLAR